jgi:hypothetical protein
MKLKFLLLKWTLRIALLQSFQAMKNASARMFGGLFDELRTRTNELDTADR